ncbi:MAG: TlpA family protein disulfide reductase [Acidimicrobiales bacterium]
MIVDIDQPLPDHPAGGPRRRRVWWVVAVTVALALVIVAIAGYAGEPGSSADVARHVEAPPFDLEDVRAAAPRVRLADYSGEPVVVNFWASWCVPCRREMPAFAEVHGELGDRVVFLGVNHQDDRGAAMALLDETGVTYPVGLRPPRGNSPGLWLVRDADHRVHQPRR